MSDEPEQKYYSVSEAAKKIPGATRRSVQRWCRDGLIGSQKVVGKYMIPEVSLEEFLKIRR